ncbi:MAG: hypothetical protein U5O39_12770 [Gammaproteobacteria bacterium]|nr:hypothetical protein [Gammaproteobacteria bacterium]
MRSWLIGFVVFGLAYAVIVAGIGVYTWPTLDTARHGTFEDDLAAVHRTAVDSVRVERNSHQADEAHRYSLTLNEDVQAIHMVNGHVIVLEPGTSRETAVAIAEAYLDRIEHYLTEARVSQTRRLIAILFVPLVTFMFFAWFARILWNKLLQVH